MQVGCASGHFPDRNTQILLEQLDWTKEIFEYSSFRFSGLRYGHKIRLTWVFSQSVTGLFRRDSVFIHPATSRNANWNFDVHQWPASLTQILWLPALGPQLVHFFWSASMTAKNLIPSPSRSSDSRFIAAPPLFRVQALKPGKGR